VSGVAFEVKADSARVDLGDGRVLYACCQGCAEYLANNRARVLELRGIAPTS
jgi:hypothetical protein